MRVVSFKLDAVITNKAKYAVLLLWKSGQTSYMGLNNKDVLSLKAVCLSLLPSLFHFFFFLFSVHMLSKCCHAWGALDFGFCGGFISFFFSLCYQLNWLNKLDRKCTEIVQCSQIRWQQILVKWQCSFLSLGKSGLVCIQLHINSRLTWQFLWDCHKQPLNSRWKVEIPSCNWWGDYSYCL